MIHAWKLLSTILWGGGRIASRTTIYFCVLFDWGHGFHSWVWSTIIMMFYLFPSPLPSPHHFRVANSSKCGHSNTRITPSTHPIAKTNQSSIFRREDDIPTGGAKNRYDGETATSWGGSTKYRSMAGVTAGRTTTLWTLRTFKEMR